MSWYYLTQYGLSWLPLYVHTMHAKTLDSQGVVSVTLI